MDSFIDFISRLIYATGTEAVLTPNHRDWLAAHPSPTGTEWLDHHVDRMLPAYEAWLASHTLPPVVPWNGARPEPWDPSADVPLGSDLDGSFTGIGSLEDLGAALRDRYQVVDNGADELSGTVKAPFSYRYWGYVKWASEMRDRYNGAVILPPSPMYDRDGTPLSAIPFSDVFNELHWRWHNSDGSTPVAAGPTPGLVSSAGQRASAGGVGMPGGEEFIRFHRDHTELFSRWLARTGQTAVRGIDMYNGGAGWPGSTNPGNPSTWVEADDDPWINDEGGDTDANLRTQVTDANDLGSSMSIHGSGHILNSDIASIFHNNYVPRFHAWHGWIDNQLWWREPRFARWDATTGLRERVFGPVLSTGADWPGLPALTIVRDPLGAGDAVVPANGVAGLDLTTGAGTLRMRLLVQDSYDRPVRLRLRADVYDDAASTTVPTETIPETTHTYIVGDTGTGDDFDLSTEFFVDLAFAGAFLSDDPTAANPAVGFVNSRIRVTGTLEVADGSDPGFTHTDFCDIRLVEEKQAPQIDLYFDLSTFGEDQVASAMGMGEARFANALIVVVQDRTSDPAPPAWPAEVADEVKGLITGMVPAAGLFDDVAHAPDVEILDAGNPIKGLKAELSSGPDPEDPSLPDGVPQRFSYRYDVVFRPGNKAFTGLPPGGSRLADVQVTTADRAGNAATATGAITLLMEANPFMRDGDTSWLSIDTRVFRLFEGETRFNTTLAPGMPTAFIQQVIQNLNGGAAGGDTFDGLPTDQPGSALEYSAAIDNPSAGTSQNVHNFALAKVRLQGAAGAADVRAFFRLFRYTSTNLVFDPATGYRTASTATPVPLLGFSSAGAGGQVISIPFFAEPRVSYTQSMTTQSDTPNVQSFPAGPSDERVLYFGAYLDINQTGARLPASYIAAHPDGGFTAGEVQSIRSLMTDAHQCMAVEVHYAGDPTATGATPASSDNLAQRNLMILYTDNPGGPLTHTVQHSFEVHTGRRLPDLLPRLEVLGLAEFLRRNDERPGIGGNGGGHGDHAGENPTGSTHDVATGDGDELSAGGPSPATTGMVSGGDPAGERAGHAVAARPDLAKLVGQVLGRSERTRSHAPLAPPPRVPLRFVSAEQRARRVRREAAAIAMVRARTMHEMMDPEPHMDEAARFVDQRFPFVFDAARWRDTTRYIDELLFRWNGLPAESRVEVYLPGIRCEDVINLRNLRHAPGDVRIVDAHTLRLDPVGVTYLPIPDTADGRLPGVVTVALPDGIRKGQRWQVDVVQLRGAERRTLGGFQMDIQVSEARAIADAERRLLVLMAERFSLTPRTDPWRPVLERRVDTLRRRARALAESAGIDWRDPTVWFDLADPSTPRPLEGASLRVVLEKIQILENREPWIKGKGEIRFAARVYTANNGAVLQQTRLPETGVFHVSDRPGRNVLELNRVLFEGYAADDLRIEIVGTEEDTFDPDDTVGKYTRLFNGSPDGWFGEYGPTGEPVDPEDMVAWKVWYRIERT